MENGGYRVPKGAEVNFLITEFGRWLSATAYHVCRGRTQQSHMQANIDQLLRLNTYAPIARHKHIFYVISVAFFPLLPWQRTGAKIISMSYPYEDLEPAMVGQLRPWSGAQ
ncbi:hypothetical protein ZWY2020_019803 [Hordeum vulgare]|nr:hypothetical protein ZWY2020_019803 [Hordeum vulgare]